MICHDCDRKTEFEHHSGLCVGCGAERHRPIRKRAPCISVQWTYHERKGQRNWFGGAPYGENPPFEGLRVRAQNTVLGQSLLGSPKGLQE